MQNSRSARIGLGLVLLGLVLQARAALGWTPATFILAAAVGVPLVVVGVFVSWRSLRGGPEDGP